MGEREGGVITSEWVSEWVGSVGEGQMRMGGEEGHFGWLDREKRPKICFPSHNTVILRGFLGLGREGKKKTLVSS